MLNRLPVSQVTLRWVAAGVLALAATSAQAVEFDEAKLGLIKASMQKFVTDQHLSGAVTAVGTADKVVHLEAVGEANLETHQAMTKESVFRIASMTKPMTAVGIMLLVDEGKLAVDDDVAKYLPEFQGQMLVEKREENSLLLKKPARPLQIRDLLTHTSGLANFPQGLGDIYGQRHRTLGEMVGISSQQPLLFEPGSKWSYCNSGIDTLGRLIEVVADQPFEEFMHERVFAPLDMNETAFYPARDLLERTAATYKRVENRLEAVPLPLIGNPTGARHPIPAGGLYSTAADVARFYQMTLRGGKVGDRQFLSAKSLAEMTRVQTGDLPCGFTKGMGFGYGFAVVREPEGVTGMLKPGSYGHGGAFGTQSWADPTQGVFFVLLIQRVGLANGDASDMRRELQTLAIDAMKK